MRLKANEEDLNVNLVRIILYRLSPLSGSKTSIDTMFETSELYARNSQSH
nr:MAG TPA: hypothetical protein [Caudoviricetes sp.]